MSIEQLINVQVTSVSKTPETLSDAPAAIYVITRDDIRRSGAETLPDILRLAPNLQVAQITASSFAITARGFNGSAASKLLVLIDGRSVYTPYHSGVDWSVQDVLPGDIERIEVISGPGAALWGANAVNGVINIITRQSSDTQGIAAEVGDGNLESRASLQYGGKIENDVSYRAYVDSFHHADDVTATGTNAQDSWHQSQGGFRFDWTPPADRVTLQGDFYGGVESSSEATHGDNLLARWSHELSNGSALQIQTYYDYNAVSIAPIASDDLNTEDFDLQHSFAWGMHQSIVWGGGLRVETDDFPTTPSSTQPLYFSPQSRTLQIGNLFVQDGISLSSALKLILGMKLEEDRPYTGLEPLPSARLAWKVTDSELVWAAISRAIRAPSRIDRDLFEAEGPVEIIRGGDFQPEELVAYEAGYRAQPSSNTSISISTFYNVYNDLRSVELSPGNQLPVEFGNMMAGETYGAEIWGQYAVRSWWRLAAGANSLHENLHFEPGSSELGPYASELGGIAIAGDDPSYQASIRSMMDLTHAWMLYLDLRRIGALPDPASPAYTELDARIAWTVSPAAEISLRGSNLLHPEHLEFGTTSATLQFGASGVETGRSVFIDGRWRF
ncbi:MAG TPA: TonB-dependent receptor [Steroidobacteraceae bacterium]|nr:TonB-dependent receptor [Steroidobacteraceae bacterium]